MKKLGIGATMLLLVMLFTAQGNNPFPPMRYMADEEGKAYGVKHILNKMEVFSSEFAVAVALGLVEGASTMNKFGKNETVAGTREPIWTVSEYYPWLDEAQTLVLKSTLNNDGPGGNGALTVEIQGMDSDTLIRLDTLTLNGTTGVPVTTDLIFVFRMRVLSSDSVKSMGTNQGDINMYNAAEDTIIAQIAAGDNQTNMCVFWVPVNKCFVMKQLYASETTNKITEFTLHAAKPTEPFQEKFPNLTKLDHFVHPMPIPLIFDPGTKIELRALSSGGGGQVTGGFDGLLLPIEMMN